MIEWHYLWMNNEIIYKNQSFYRRNSILFEFRVESLGLFGDYEI